MNRLTSLAISAAALLGLAASAFADEDPARVTGAVAEPVTAVPGGKVAVRVDVEVDKPYHLYGLKEAIGLPPKFVPPEGGWPKGLTAGEVTESPEPKKKDLAGMETLVHEGKVSFTLTFAVAADAVKGAREVAGSIELQACDENSCLLPKKVPFSAKFEIGEPPPVQIARTAFVPAEAPPGGDATVEVEFAIGKGWHLYAQRHREYRPPTFEWKLLDGWKAKGELVEVTPPHEADFFGEKLFAFEGKCVLRQTFTLPVNATPGAVELAGTASWQQCNDQVCTDEKGVPLSATLIVAVGAAAAPAGDSPAQQARPPEPPSKPSQPPQDGEEQTLWGVLLSGMAWGLLTVITPCVFPLLPVTVSYFSKQQGPALPRSTVYALGIVFTLTVIGLIFKGSLDVFARGTAFNLFVGALFIVLALSLFGLFELRLPSFLIDKSQEKSGGGGLAGAFFMAVTLALTSFSCSVPFLAIMFSRFDRGEVGLSVLGLLGYSVTVALPFFVCSLSPSLLKSVPKSGGWLNAVKVTMGFVELGLAFKFLRTPTLVPGVGSEWLPRSLVLALWIACALGAALYLFGYITLPHDTKTESIGVFRLFFAVAFLMSAVYMLPGVFGRPLAPWLDGFLQTDEAELVAEGPAKGSSHGAETAWVRNDWDGSLARAAEKRRPALFDFTGVG
jgi:thiol:disulfide interchange protein DsbD